MNKKTGTARSPVVPIAPVAAQDADVADPGKTSEIKADQRQAQSGKYGATKAKPFRPALEEPSAGGASATAAQENEQKKTGWIEIELLGEDDRPIPGERYRVTLPDQTVDEGTLDQNGWARVEGFEKGMCKITFPDLDHEAWEFIESGGSKTENSES